MGKLRKVVNLKVFDFDTHRCAYALNSDKNHFGYMYQNQYYYGGRLIYESPEYDNVEDQAFYWLAFKINRSQMASLQKRIDKLIDDDASIAIIGDSVRASFSNGSHLSYKGNYPLDFAKTCFVKTYSKK